MMTDLHASGLLAFAERMASLAVRTGNPQLVREGLEALAFGAGLVDIREAILILPLLYQSLRKLDVDATNYFAGAIGLGDAQFDSVLREFPNRDEENRSIEVMGYIEGRDQDGFRYVRTW
jgi:hypothetical protein